jgi:hypothetical protein
MRTMHCLTPLERFSDFTRKIVWKWYDIHRTHRTERHPISFCLSMLNMR